MELDNTETLHEKLKKVAEAVGDLLVDGFHLTEPGLFPGIFYCLI